MRVTMRWSHILKGARADEARAAADEAQKAAAAAEKKR
jgi:hypothetical protein